MRNILSRRGHEAPFVTPELENIWYVDADASYHVTRQGEKTRPWVAVRTLNGQGYLQLSSGEEMQLSSGSLVFLEGASIRKYGTEKNRWEFYWFEFEWPEENLLSRSRVLFPAVSAQERQEMERCFDLLGRASPHECAAAGYFFAALLAHWQLASMEADGDDEKIRMLLEKGRREKCPVSQLAREAGMSERSFRNAVWKIAGESPKAYMLRREMEAAMELLRTTSMTVSEIALSLHYGNPFYFSRVFKKYYGLAPEHARKGKE